MSYKIIYPEKPKRSKGYDGGGIIERTYKTVFRFYTKNGFKETSIDYGKGYLQALSDIKRLNKNHAI